MSKDITNKTLKTDTIEIIKTNDFISQLWKRAESNSHSLPQNNELVRYLEGCSFVLKSVSDYVFNEGKKSYRIFEETCVFRNCVIEEKEYIKERYNQEIIKSVYKELDLIIDFINSYEETQKTEIMSFSVIIAYVDDKIRLLKWLDEKPYPEEIMSILYDSLGRVYQNLKGYRNLEIKTKEETYVFRNYIFEEKERIEQGLDNLEIADDIMKELNLVISFINSYEEENKTEMMPFSTMILCIKDRIKALQKAEDNSETTSLLMESYKNIDAKLCKKSGLSSNWREFKPSSKSYIPSFLRNKEN